MHSNVFSASQIPTFHSTAYGWLMLAAVATSLVLWSRLARQDSRMIPIYFGALAGAFLGAKLVYLAAEGWLHWHDPNRWVILATGKSITGALLGGYAGVEIAKRLIGYRGATGDWFAIDCASQHHAWPGGLRAPRLLSRPPCEESWFTVRDAAGQARWPAAQTELIFNAVALGAVLILRRWKLWPGQHFHLYLVAYGVFRFFHEFLRATPLILGSFSGYQVAALGVAMLGLAAFESRRRRRFQRISPGARRASTDGIKPASLEGR